ncbi:MAG: glycine zipper 2TM domain-containing protein [Gammaproteobacteria bacterium]
MRYLSLVVLASTLFIGGCASSLSGSAYERRQARTVQEVELGVVEHVRTVQIEGTKSGIGAHAGAAAGGVAGSEIGQGKGRVVGAIAGAVVGGVAGAAAEERLTRQPGLEITVRLDSGRLVAITQAADEAFRVGERVRLIHGGRGGSRVTH